MSVGAGVVMSMGMVTDASDEPLPDHPGVDDTGYTIEEREQFDTLFVGKYPIQFLWQKYVQLSSSLRAGEPIRVRVRLSRPY